MLLLLLFTGACRQQMADQPAYRPLTPSNFFGDNRSARPLVAGTVARGQLREDEHLYQGVSGGALATTFPFEVTRAVIERGRERYNIYCAHCHSRTGDGLGVIVKRGYRKPPSFHIDRLRQAPPGHFFDVITNGFGAMPSHSYEVPVRDRWAITAYIRALQTAYQGTLAELPGDVREKLERERQQPGGGQ